MMKTEAEESNAASNKLVYIYFALVIKTITEMQSQFFLIVYRSWKKIPENHLQL